MSPAVVVSRKRGTALATCLAVGTLAIAGLTIGAPVAAHATDVVQNQPAPAAPAASVAPPAASAAHPYSDAVWSPLRTPANITCVKTNCGNTGSNLYHGYWAVDFVGREADPVYAAGAGTVHIGAISPACVAAGSRPTAGTWIWVDHGGGHTTRYHHLGAVLVKEGQLVTPATMIARMGHSGYNFPCRANYLHFEERTGGFPGLRVQPRQLKACVSGRVQSMPGVFGTSDWDKLVSRENNTPHASNACITASVWTGTPSRPAFTIKREAKAATVDWTKPASNVNQVRVTLEKWAPSLNRYTKAVYRTVNVNPQSGTSSRFTGLTNGETYRFNVATHNAAGWSAWGASKRVIPAGVPSIPVFRFVQVNSNTLYYGWWHSYSIGEPVTKYVGARRCIVKGKYAPWSYFTVDAKTYNYITRGLAQRQTCQIEVRGHNAIGASGWSTTTTATTTSR